MENVDIEELMANKVKVDSRRSRQKDGFIDVAWSSLWGQEKPQIHVA